MSLITAHSGCDDTPDNSIEFLAYAFNSNADVVEIDVRRGKNGQLMLSHDHASDGLTLESALNHLKQSSKKLNCDLKESGLEAQVFALARSFQVENKLIYSGTVQPDPTSDWFKQVDVFYNIELAVENVRIFVSPGYESDRALFVESILSKQVTCINMPEFVYAQNRELFDRIGCQCSVWTVNDPQLIELYLRKNIFNLTTRSLSQALILRDRIQEES